MLLLLEFFWKILKCSSSSQASYSSINPDNPSFPFLIILYLFLSCRKILWKKSPSSVRCSWAAFLTPTSPAWSSRRGWRASPQTCGPSSHISDGCTISRATCSRPPARCCSSSAPSAIAAGCWPMSSAACTGTSTPTSRGRSRSRRGAPRSCPHLSPSSSRRSTAAWSWRPTGSSCGRWRENWGRWKGWKYDLLTFHPSGLKKTEKELKGWHQCNDAYLCYLIFIFIYFYKDNYSIQIKWVNAMYI